MKKLFTLIVFVGFLVSAKAQVRTRTVEEQFIESRIARGIPSAIEVVEMPPVDVQSLLVEDEIEESLGFPYRFGVIIDVNLNLQNSGSWSKLPNGARIWKLNIVSKGAFSINLAYKKFELPKGSELYIYNNEKTILQGPLNSIHNSNGGAFATDLLPGKSIILEYYEPEEAKNKGKIYIDKVIHGYKDI